MSHGLGMSFTSFLQASVGDIPEILGDYIQNWTFTKPCSIVPWSVVLTILKNMKVNGKDDIPYIFHILWKIKAMFQTTNQFPIEVYHGDLILWMIVVQEIREHQSSS